jgi:two-component system, NarL family, sensor histidine kinase DesK
MPPKMVWLAAVVRLAITPVFLGALSTWLEPQRSGRDVTAGAGLALLGAVHLLYWSRPWPAQQRRAVVAAAAMVLTNVVLLHVLDLSEPLLWLYPALVVGAGLRPRAAAVGVGLMAVAAVVPAAAHVEIEGTHLVRMLGPGHAILLAVALAGLGMTAVRQLIAVNADLHATRAELADLAVAAERERLARELHDLLGRTLSLIAVKAELASRLSAKGDPSAGAELGDVQRLARQAVRDVREAIAGDHAPSVDAELAAAEAALRTAGIKVSVDNAAASIDPAHETTIAWALREAVTNVVKHSGARTCRIWLQAADGVAGLEVVDDGRGAVGADAGTGLNGLARRVHARGGAFEAGPSETGGFRLRVWLGAAAPSRAQAGIAR